MIFQKELINSLENNSEHIAIESAERLVSYSNLKETSDAITHFLMRKNLPKETMVGILMDDRIELITSVIGILNSRCVIVPINPALPVNRIKSIIQTLNLKHVITSTAVNAISEIEVDESLNQYLFKEVVADKDNFTVEEMVYPDFGENDSIYIYFTSGSTGEPKGIIGRNMSLIQFLRWEIEAFSIDSSFRISQLITPYFDAFLRDVFVPLLAGGTVCIPPIEEDFLSHDKLTKWLSDKAINLIHCVPSLFRVINQPSLTEGQLGALKYVLLSGERIVPSELINWYEVFGDRIQLANLYGATESTMVRSCYLIKPEDAKKPKISIGQPISDTEFLISNKDLKPCNKLITGDLYIISQFVSKGYYGMEELTNEKFLPINSELLGDAIAYKTGDKARVMANGDIDLLGREDRQIKLRGIRVDLDEVESVLNGFELVNKAIVILDDDKKGSERLLAFLEANQNTPADFDERINVLVKSNLPDYMIPSEVTKIDHFPLLANGKIDYEGLLALKKKDVIVTPDNDIEEELLSIWQGILGDLPISTVNTFQSYGGNSLSIMRLIGQIYNKFNIRIPLADLFNNLTIKKQALLVKSLSKDSALIIKKAEEKPSYPVSLAQHRLYYNYEMNKESTAFNIPLAWKIKGQIDELKIEKAISKLIERHEGLRTKFVNIEGQVQQVVQNNVSFDIERVNTTEEGLNDTIINFIRPFDLEKSPLLRCGIISTDADEKIIVFDIHHIICDGISQTVIFSDFLKFYTDQELAPLEIQYKDFAQWESEFRKSDEYISHREFWLSQFEGDLPKLEFPTTADQSLESDEGGHLKFQIDKSKFQPVLDHLKKEEISVFSGLFSIFFIFLSKLTGQEDIVLGINTSGRAQTELDKLVGMFVKTLPIRSQIDMDLSFVDWVPLIHKHLIKAMSNQVYDLTDIVSELRKSDNDVATDLIRAMFVFRNFEMEEVETERTVFAAHNIENNTSKYPITLFITDDESTFNCRFEYSTNYFNRVDVELFIEQFNALVENIGGNLETTIIDLLTQGESSYALQIDEEDIDFNF